MNINKTKIIILTLVMLSLVFIYLGINSTYNVKYKHTFGYITDKKIYSINTTHADRQAMGINVYTNKNKYRLEVYFNFYHKGKLYESSFYNNGSGSDYVDNDILKKHSKMFFRGDIIKIYYNKDNPNDCGINMTEIKKRNSHYYYLIVIFIIFLYFFYKWLEI